MIRSTVLWLFLQGLPIIIIIMSWEPAIVVFNYLIRDRISFPLINAIRTRPLTNCNTILICSRISCELVCRHNFQLQSYEFKWRCCSHEHELASRFQTRSRREIQKFIYGPLLWPFAFFWDILNLWSIFEVRVLLGWPCDLSWPRLSVVVFLSAKRTLLFGIFSVSLRFWLKTLPSTLRLINRFQYE